jgi:ParB family transcriptional regulator, chromosome partitioning protein
MTTATIAPPVDNAAIATGQKPQQRGKSPVDSQRLVQAQNTSANDTIDPRELDASRYQFRKQPNPKAKAELAESIGVKGITNPLLVQTSRKAIIAGFTRHEIAIEGEFTEVPIRWLDVDDDEAADIAAIDNTKRADLNPIDETEMVVSILQRKLKFASAVLTIAFLHQAAHTKEQTGNNVIPTETIEFATEIIRQFTKGGMSLTSFVKNKLKLLNLPENILDSVRSGELHYTKAAAISTLEDPSRQELLDRSIEEGLSVREVKAEVAKIKPPKAKTDRPTTELPVKVIADRQEDNLDRNLTVLAPVPDSIEDRIEMVMEETIDRIRSNKFSVEILKEFERSLLNLQRQFLLEIN